MPNSSNSQNSAQQNLRGATLMVLSMLGYGCNDALIKLAAQDLALFQSIFIRGLFLLALVSLMLFPSRRYQPLPKPADWKLLGLRVIGEICSTTCFLIALINMPIANVTAVLQATPIAVTLAASFVLGETIGWRRYAAIACGFAGVLLLIKPGSSDFSVYSLWALAAVLFLVLRDLCTRKLSASVPSLLVTFITAVSITVFSGTIVYFDGWQPLDAAQPLLLLLLAAVFLLGGYLFGIMAMRIGEIGFVAPFRYTIMIWAIGLGIILFNEIPDTSTLLGTAIVAGTGIYAFYRERQQQRKAK